MLERGSTRHSARVDERLESETESVVRGAPIEVRAQEWRQMEPAAEDEPTPSAVVSTNDIELRSLLATSLRPSAFPGDRSRLLEVAREEHAEARILAWLAALPNSRQFANVQSVWEALGGAHESREESPFIADPETGPTPSTVEPQPQIQTAPADVPEARDTFTPAPPASLVARAAGLALAAVSVGIGLTIEAVRTLRGPR